MDWKVILLALLVAVAPFAGAWLWAELTLFLGWVNALPTFFRGLVNAVAAFLLSMLAQALGVQLPTDLAGLNGDMIAAILVALAHLIAPVQAQLKALRVKRGLAH